MATTELRERGADLSRLKSDKQRQFALEWLIDRNATQAAIRAGYSKNRASVTSTNLMKHPVIKAFHGKFIREQCERLKIKAEDVIEQLYFALMTPKKDFVDNRGIPLPINELPPQCQTIIDGFETDVLRTKTRVDGKTTIIEELVRTKIKLTPHATARQQALQHRGLLEAQKIEAKLTLDWGGLYGRPNVIDDPVSKAIADQLPKLLEEET